MNTPSFRPATASDATDLTLLFDIAARGFMSWYWGQSAQQGQSVLEIGRQEIRDDPASEAHFRRWQILTLDGQTVGAICSYPMATSEEASDLPAPVLPFVQLEHAALGTYYVLVVAIFAEHRGKGFGAVLLDKAIALARAAGAAQLTLIAEAFNTGAYRFYLSHGFREGPRLPFVPFPDCDDAGEVVLMIKDLN